MRYRIRTLLIVAAVGLVLFVAWRWMLPPPPAGFRNSVTVWEWLASWFR